jgi:hypothetical protein
MLAPHTPRQNHLLAALPATEYEHSLSGKATIGGRIS